MDVILIGILLAINIVIFYKAQTLYIYALSVITMVFSIYMIMGKVILPSGHIEERCVRFKETASVYNKIPIYIETNECAKYDTFILTNELK